MGRTFIDRRASESDHRIAKKIAQAVLDGRTAVLEAARALVSLAHTDAVADAEDRKLIIAIESETDHLPVGRSAPAIVVSGPAQRSLVLWPARSPSRHATPYTESSDSFDASAAVSIVTGWGEPVPGREFHPLKSSAFHGALLRQLTPLLVRMHPRTSGEPPDVPL